MKIHKKKVWVIAFKDGETECYYRKELLDKEGCVVDYGDVLTFDTEKECADYMDNNTDSRCFDFYVKQVIDEVEVEDERKGN
jgi:hypothetical protein